MLEKARQETTRKIILAMVASHNAKWKKISSRSTIIYHFEKNKKYFCTSSSNAPTAPMSKQTNQEEEPTGTMATISSAMEKIGTKGSFFSRMSSLGNTAAPLLGEVYDLAQKKATQLKEHAAIGLREAHLISPTDSEFTEFFRSGSRSAQENTNSVDLTQQDTMTPKDAPLLDEEESREALNQRNDIVSDDVSPRSPMRFAAATNAVVNAYSEFKTVGRYRMMKDNEPPQNLMSVIWNGQDEAEKSFESSAPRVGGADKLGGLGRLKMDDIVSMLGGSVRVSSISLGDSDDDDINSIEEEQKIDSISSAGVSAENSSNDGGSVSNLTSSAGSAISSNNVVKTRGPPKRSHSYYEEAVKSLLLPGQRALFFGKGTMGVILKPTYLASWRGKDGGGLLSPASPSAKTGGVFIDALVPGGHAEKSGVVHVGDHVLRIGSLDVSNMTLEDVVKVIAEAERPNIMVLTAEHEVTVVSIPETVCSEELGGRRKFFVSGLDLTFGFVNKFAAEGFRSENDKDMHLRSQCESSLFEADNDGGETIEFAAEGNMRRENSLQYADNAETVDDKCDTDGVHKSHEQMLFDPSNFSARGGDASCFSSKISATDDETETTSSTTTNVVAKRTPDEVEFIVGTSIPSSSIESHDDFDKLVSYSTHRTNGYKNDSRKHSRSHSLPVWLGRAALLCPDFRCALHEGFKICCTDPRRYNFMEHFFQHYFSQIEVDTVQRQDRRNGLKNLDLDQRLANEPTSSANQKKLLILYHDLLKFRLLKVCSDSDREKLLEFARLISKKFIFNDDDFERSPDCLSENVIDSVFGSTDCVQTLRRALADEDYFFEGENDGFFNIRNVLGEYLSIQEPFLTFLISDDCARMRAYLHGTAPFSCLEPSSFLKPGRTDDVNRNLLIYAILHLVCIKEHSDEIESSDDYGVFIKMDTLILNELKGNRIIGAVSIVSCAIFISRSLMYSLQEAMEGLVEDEMTGSTSNKFVFDQLIQDIEFLWENFVSPVCGSLSSLCLSDDTQLALVDIRNLLASSANWFPVQNRNLKSHDSKMMAKFVTSTAFSISLQNLSDALIRDYCLHDYSNFRRHIFHEWALRESAKYQIGSANEVIKINDYLISFNFDGLPKGCIKQVLRSIELPHGLSLHRQGSIYMPKFHSGLCENPTANLFNADVAVVFGTRGEESGLSSAEQISGDSNVCRFTCVSMHSHENDTIPPTEKKLSPEDIPGTFEEYMMSPPFSDRPFQGMLQDEENGRLSIDGWEVSLTNVMIPAGTGSSEMLYCTSLMLKKASTNDALHDELIDEHLIDDLCVGENQHNVDNDAPPQCKVIFQSPLTVVDSNGRKRRRMKVPHSMEILNQKLKDQRSSRQKSFIKSFGISLVSSRNVIPAMRHSLSLLYDDLCRINSSDEWGNNITLGHACRPLIDLLGVFTNNGVEETSLKSLLEPYLNYTSSLWIHRPLSDQSTQMTNYCGNQMIQSLPPVPLALLIVTVLLEQKVVLSSSRRAMLMSASVAIMELLKPLRWTHLLVPLAPISMVNDLIHYPAPFILGLSTDEKKSASILRSLPPDVTLVDLDVGRVMLASEFVSGDDSKSTAGLRTQSLLLAEFLGGAIGSAILEESWKIECPLHVITGEVHDKPQSEESNFGKLRRICEVFLTELLCGIPSCCVWIEEDSQDMAVIVFDEERFYNLKNLRACGLINSVTRVQVRPNTKFSLSLDRFKLFIEAFLRTQSLSTFISTGDKKSMLFW